MTSITTVPETTGEPPLDDSARDVHRDGLGPEALAVALRELRDAGLTTVENAIPLQVIDELRTAYDTLLDSHPDGRVQNTSGNQHLQMQLPIQPPFSDPQVVTHPVVTQVVGALLGADFTCCYYNSNTALPGSTHQAVHRDTSPLFRSEVGVPTPPVGIVVNIPLVDFTVENGSTEVWPTTHLITDQPDEAATLDERTAPLASIRLNAPAGSIVLRDLRAWHRGTPNMSAHQRTMLAIVYHRGFLGWLHQSMQVSESVFAAWPEETQRVFAKLPRTAG
jgi:Phytanoyl-CoA dioxygenase (PhyH)